MHNVRKCFNIVRQKKGLHTLVPWVSQNNLKIRKIKNANDCFLFTDDNKKIIDFTSGLMVVNLGHNNKYIIDGMKKHLNSGISFINSQFVTNQREQLSEQIINCTNYNGGKVFYTNGGADANETAIFLANDYHYHNGSKNKKKVLSFEKSFHGGSSIAASLLSGDIRCENKKS